MCYGECETFLWTAVLFDVCKVQTYSEKYQHWQILTAEICPALCPLTDISEKEHPLANLEARAFGTVKYLLNSVCINGNEDHI